MDLIPRTDRLGIAPPAATRVRLRAAARRHRVPILSAALAASTLWAAAASYGLAFHDRTLAGLLAQQRAQQIAYEERTAALQAQAARTAADRPRADGFDERLAALIERQALIEKRQGLLSDLGAAPAAPEAPPGLRLRGGDRSEAVRQRLTGLEGRLDRLAEHQSRVLGGVADRTRRSLERLHATLRLAGLDPARFAPAGQGLGGPLVPLSEDAFDRALAEARHAAEEERRLALTVAGLPLRRPLAEEAVQTSGFGTRLDPFTHGLALHTGLDLRAEHGTAARATAPGRVSLAEFSGGYGNMVEIDHGHGIATRYAHLARLAVAPGQFVEAGAVVGRVGSTGRSTGTHLHYETRLDGEPVDPERFLRAGENLPVAAPAAEPDPSRDDLLGESWRAWTARQMRALSGRYSMSSTASAPP